MDSIIEVRNLGKKYFIGNKEQYLALRDILANIVKAPSRWLRKKANSAGSGMKTSDFWALSDVNFEVERGDVLGIIGRNGAGKSTLLKILSRITPPTTGEIRIKGRVGSLLEVGTGFHPELTGRENIYLNGAILGMRKAEIKKKFEEIVSFSGIEKFLDTPVKRYSSGMYVRLAFAVAAHLEPDILLVDEVLAVGDAEFQKKCLGKMEEVAKKDGRTVLFVSHNMGAIKSLCNKCLLLDGGKVKKIGSTGEVVNEYISKNSALAEVDILPQHHVRGSMQAVIEKVTVLNKENNSNNSFLINEIIKFRVDYTIKDDAKEYSFWLIIFDNDGTPLVSSFQKDNRSLIKADAGKHRIEIEFDMLGLLPGSYTVSIGIFFHDGLAIWNFADWVDHCLTINITEAFEDGRIFDRRWGKIDRKAQWNVIN